MPSKRRRGAFNYLKDLIELKGRNEVKIINRYEIAEYLDTDERQVRKAISEVRKHIDIVYIPANKYNAGWYHFTKGDYVLYDPKDVFSQEALDKTVKDDYNSFMSLYFDNVLPLKKLVRDQNLINKLGQVVLPLEENDEKV